MESSKSLSFASSSASKMPLSSLTNLQGLFPVPSPDVSTFSSSFSDSKKPLGRASFKQTARKGDRSFHERIISRSIARAQKIRENRAEEQRKVKENAGNELEMYSESSATGTIRSDRMGIYNSPSSKFVLPNTLTYLSRSQTPYSGCASLSPRKQYSPINCYNDDRQLIDKIVKEEWEMYITGSDSRDSAEEYDEEEMKRIADLVYDKLIEEDEYIEKEIKTYLNQSSSQESDHAAEQYEDIDSFEASILEEALQSMSLFEGDENAFVSCPLCKHGKVIVNQNKAKFECDRYPKFASSDLNISSGSMEDISCYFSLPLTSKVNDLSSLKDRLAFLYSSHAHSCYGVPNIIQLGSDMVKAQSPNHMDHPIFVFTCSSCKVKEPIC